MGIVDRFRIYGYNKDIFKIPINLFANLQEKSNIHEPSIRIHLPYSPLPCHMFVTHIKS